MKITNSITKPEISSYLTMSLDEAKIALVRSAKEQGFVFDCLTDDIAVSYPDNDRRRSDQPQNVRLIVKKDGDKAGISEAQE